MQSIKAITIQTTSHRIIYLLITLSGFASLSWEIIWQIKATLALGISAWGTAITLAVMMGGLGAGSLGMGHALKKVKFVKVGLIYCLLEFTIGTAGLLLNSCFHILEKFDTFAYQWMPNSISLVYFSGMLFIIGLPALCMGATFPVFGIISKSLHVSIPKLYGINTLGAAIGVVFTAFVFIPLLGISQTIYTISAINMFIGVLGWILLTDSHSLQVTPSPAHIRVSKNALFIIFITGFATFTLEVAWFRSLSSIFSNTTDVFAIMLMCVLIALGLAAKNVPSLKKKQKLLGSYLCLSGILILFVTPLIEHLDMFIAMSKIAATHQPLYSNLDWLLLDSKTYMLNWLAVTSYMSKILIQCIVIFCIIVPPLKYLSVAFPWILDDFRDSYQLGKLYAVNMLAAILGSLMTAWLLLPHIGFAKSAWIAGIMVIIAGALILPVIKRVLWCGLAAIALFIAIFFETGIGKVRVQGYFASDHLGQPAKLLEFYEGPQATTSAVEYQDGSRALLINNALAAGESGKVYDPRAHYLKWMGHLPMMIHSNPKKALVICFGTGQTADAVRSEMAESIDIVDVNPNVFKLAHYFRANKNVLLDPKVTAIVMDGRAYLRRTKKTYDVITLEPMPPIANGVNALYSKEFYKEANKRLNRGGVIAQWLPFHVTSPQYSASIAKTFIEVFPNALLWIDSDAKMGILLGSKEKLSMLEHAWPGFGRSNIKRDLSSRQIQAQIALDSTALRRYAAYGEIITDDNQLLAYGKALYVTNLLDINFSLLNHFNNNIIIPHDYS